MSHQPNKQEAPALLPCPFCGGPAETRITDGPHRGFIGCFTCMIGTPFNVPYGERERERWNSRSAGGVVATVDEQSAVFTAYNQAIEDAKAAIHGERIDDPWANAVFINAIARKCSPHVYVNRLSAASPAAPKEEAEPEVIARAAAIEISRAIIDGLPVDDKAAIATIIQRHCFQEKL